MTCHQNPGPDNDNTGNSLILLRLLNLLFECLEVEGDIRKHVLKLHVEEVNRCNNQTSLAPSILYTDLFLLELSVALH